MNVSGIANLSRQLLSLAIATLILPAPVSAAQSAQTGGQPSMEALRAACTADVQRLCAGVQPGGGRIVSCLKENKNSLSDRCKQAAGLAANPGGPYAPGAAGALPSTGANAPVAAAPAAAPKASAANAPSGTSVATQPAPANAERFVERIIADPQHEGMRVATIHLPEKWRFESQLEWHYDRIEVPLIYSSHAENPDNAEAYFQYPLLRAETVDVAPQYRRYVKNQTRPGDRLPTGAINLAPMPPLQAMVKFIQQTRPNAANLKWIAQSRICPTWPRP